MTFRRPRKRGFCHSQLAIAIRSDISGRATPAGRQATEGETVMKAIQVTDQTAGTAGMKLVERPEPKAAINDVIVRIHASGFVGNELTWPSTWAHRSGSARAPTIPG